MLSDMAKAARPVNEQLGEAISQSIDAIRKSLFEKKVAQRRNHLLLCRRLGG